MPWQEIIVGIIVAVAAVYCVRGVRARLSALRATACGDGSSSPCGGCSLRDDCSRDSRT